MVSQITTLAYQVGFGTQKKIYADMCQIFAIDILNISIRKVPNINIVNIVRSEQARRICPHLLTSESSAGLCHSFA